MIEIYLGIWLALGVASVIYCLVTEGTSFGELFELENAIVAIVIVILGPIVGGFVACLNFCMRDK